MSVCPAVYPLIPKNRCLRNDLVIAALQTHEQNGNEIIEDNVFEEFLSKSSPTGGDNNLSET